jgi:hypothetical protein
MGERQAQAAKGGCKVNLALKCALIRDGRPCWRVAVEAGMSPTVLSRIVSGRREASRVEREALAEVLEVEPSELFAPGDVRTAA